MRDRRVQMGGAIAPVLILFALVVAAGTVGVARAQVQQQQAPTKTSTDAPPIAARQEAETLFQKQQWSEAARAYEALAQREPLNGQEWLRLGHSLHSTGQYVGAAEAYQKAVAHATAAPAAVPAMYRLARVYSLLKEKEKAFTWLQRALEAGFSQVRMLSNEADLAFLRDDPRFKEVTARAEANARPCPRQPEARQFDFWVGEWEVQAGGQTAGTNSVQLILGDCVVFENWTGAGGMQGKSFNFYDAGTGKWHQTWVDDRGTVLQLTGGYSDGAMRFTGETVARDGKKIAHRLTSFKLSADRVRQLWEQSNDEGKTWNVAFDGTYIRKK